MQSANSSIMVNNLAQLLWRKVKQCINAESALLQQTGCLTVNQRISETARLYIAIVHRHTHTHTHTYRKPEIQQERETRCSLSLGSKVPTCTEAAAAAHIARRREGVVAIRGLSACGIYPAYTRALVRTSQSAGARQLSRLSRAAREGCCWPAFLHHPV